MVENDTDIVRVAKSEKTSLLERYDIPVEHLSYEYISECTNAKKLEHIVTILRSGEEGCYPDLTKHAEQRLTIVKPTSIILRKSEPILKRDMLQPNECKEIDKHINDWMAEMQIREKDLEEGKFNMVESLSQPDVRQIKEPVKKNCITNSKNTTKSKRIASCDYSAWDKYDVDTELNKIDIRDEQQLIEAKKFQQMQKEVTEKKKPEKHTIIDKSSLTGTELDVMAEQEKEKGNEAFRAGDYEEALEYFNTSIKMNSNITTYNNRGLTYIKLQRYEDAVNDCNIVLSVEYTNIKALLRRALALEYLQKPSQALIDYEAVLKLEPSNKMAICGVKKLRKPCGTKKIRMTIKEQQIEDINKTSKSNRIEKEKNYTSQFSSKLNLSNICYCDKAPGPSQNLRPRPHIKADYCLENDNIQATMIKSAASKKLGSDHRKNESKLNKNQFSNLSSSISKLSQENDSSNTITKQKSIFSFTRPPKQSSSVIIEELPNETSNNNEALVNNNPNTKIASKSKAPDNKPMKGSDKNLNENCEHNYKLNNKSYEKSSPNKTQVTEKCGNKFNKEEKYISKDFNNIDNGYEFMRVWRSLKNDTDLETYAQLLKSFDADKLISVLGNELDGNIFSTILRCLERHFCTSKDIELLSNLLKSFSQVKRFSIVNMFMNTEDKQAVKNIFNFLEEHGTSEVSTLRQIYCT